MRTLVWHVAVGLISGMICMGILTGCSSGGGGGDRGFSLTVGEGSDSVTVTGIPDGGTTGSVCVSDGECASGMCVSTDLSSSQIMGVCR